MKGAMFWIVVLFLPTLLSAAPARVQTGEHVGFTRVVITLAENADWIIGRSETGYDIRLVPNEGFDLREFYDLIPQRRIAEVAVSADGTILSLLVRCQCALDAFVYRDRFLVVDVRDGVPDPGSPFEETLTPTRQQGTLRGSRQLVISPRRVIPLLPSTGPGSLMGNAIAGPATDLSAPVPPAASLSVGADESDSLPSPSHDLSKVGSEIAVAVARALSQGLIVPDTNTPVQPRPAVSDPLGIPGMTMRTASQLDDMMSGSAAAQEPFCSEDEAFAFAAWADDRLFHVQLREQSALVFAEDRPADLRDLVALARLHLAFGFAAEARQLLATDGRKSAETTTIMTLADILAGQQVGDGAFAAQVVCDGSVALWAMLAGGDASAADAASTEAVITAFRELPNSVKAIAGPRLVEAMLAAGKIEAAQQIMGRIQQDVTDPAALATAASDLETAQDRPESAAAILDDALADRRAISSSVMTRILENDATAGLALDNDTIALSDALVFEARGTGEAAELAEAQFRFLLSAGSFAAAAKMIDDRVIPVERATPEDLRQLFAEAAILRMADMDFGRYGWNDALLPRDPTTRGRIAERLLSLGFAERAAALLQSEAPGSTTTARPMNVGTVDVADPEKGLPIDAARPSGASGPPETGLADLRDLVAASRDLRAETVDALRQNSGPVE